MAADSVLPFCVWKQNTSFAFTTFHLFSGQLLLLWTGGQYNQIVFQVMLMNKRFNICHMSRLLLSDSKSLSLKTSLLHLPMTILFNSFCGNLGRHDYWHITVPCKFHISLYSPIHSFVHQSSYSLALMDWHSLSYAVRAMRRHHHSFGSLFACQRSKGHFVNGALDLMAL
jgi:hypothetical protein